jgi:Putative metal-binding motif
MPRINHTSLKGLLLKGLLLGAVVLLTMGVLAPSPPAHAADKVKVCHRPPGNPSNIQIITVDVSAVAAHIAHGDTLVETFYHDADGDGYGTPLSTIQACSAPPGFVANNTDCDDSDAAVHPGAIEIRGNGIDDDCDATTLDVVGCPCEGLSAGGIAWDNSFRSTTIQCTEGVATPVTLTGTGGVLRLVSGKGSFCFIIADGQQSLVLNVPTSEEIQACAQSIREIAANDGVTCPP